MFGKLKTGNLFSKKPSGIATIDTPRRFWFLCAAPSLLNPLNLLNPLSLFPISFDTYLSPFYNERHV